MEGRIRMKVQSSFIEPKPTLYLVSTPIGNLGDITKRAIETLQIVDLILCEDTRVSGKLLSYLGIKKPLESYQQYNEKEKANEIIEKMKSGMSIALISDAGTPLVNDPGFILVKKAIEEDIIVTSIPGASAMLAALVSSGLVPQPFTFIGFLPRKQGDFIKSVSQYQGRSETLIIYESPNRVSKTLIGLFDILGDRKLVLARELTKKFETLYRGTLKAMKDLVFDNRGEYVILLEGEFKEHDEVIDVASKVEYYKEQGLEEKEALKKVAKELGVHKSEIYKIYKIVKSHD